LALFTALAFLAAGLAAKRAGEILGIEKRRDQRAVEREEQEQARLVSSWIHHRGGPMAKPVNLLTEILVLALRNASALSVQNVVVYMVLEDGREYGIWGSPVLAPNDRPDLPNVDSPAGERVAMAFTDMAGNTWHRDGWGRLSKMRSIAPPFVPPADDHPLPSDDEP
jgi:hypothetical protein